MNPPRWLTVREAATYAEVSPATIQRWIRERRIGALELGGARTVYRIHTEDLDKLIRRRTTGAEEDAGTVPEFDARDLLERLPVPGHFPLGDTRSITWLDLLEEQSAELAATGLIRSAAGDQPVEMDVHAVSRGVSGEPSGWQPASIHPVWMLPFDDRPIPERIDAVGRQTSLRLNADLVTISIDRNGWVFSSGRRAEATGIADLTRPSVAGEVRIASVDLDQHRTGKVATALIDGSLRPAGLITAVVESGSANEEELRRNLHLAAGVVETILRDVSDQWLDMSDVAERCGVTEPTVRRWIRQKQLAAIILGGHRAEYRVHESDLDWFIFQRSRSSSSVNRRPASS